MSTIKEILNETRIIIDPRIVEEAGFYWFLEKNGDTLRSSPQKLLIHKSVCFRIFEKHQNNLNWLKSNKMLEYYGTEDCRNIERDTLYLLIANCKKQRFTLVSRHFCLCKSAEAINDFRTAVVLGIKAKTVDEDGNIDTYEIMDPDYFANLMKGESLSDHYFVGANENI